MKRHARFLFIGIIFLLVLTAALAPGRQARASRAAVTLLSFIAFSPSDGDPMVFILWETATELDTSGYYVQRSETNAGDTSYERVSEFIFATGNNISGDQYYASDETTELNKLYYYRLEEVPQDQADPSVFYPPVAVVAGMLETPTSTATPSRTPTATPTRTPTPTATTTTASSQQPVANTPVPVVATQRIATPALIMGATVTPRPNNRPSQGNAPTTVATQVAEFQPSDVSSTPAPGVTPLAMNQEAANQTAAAQPAPGEAPATGAQPPAVQQPAVPGQVPAPQTGPTAIAVAPVVIPSAVPEAAPTGSSSSSTSFLILIAAAVLLLVGGIAVIMRHTGR